MILTADDAEATVKMAFSAGEIVSLTAPRKRLVVGSRPLSASLACAASFRSAIDISLPRPLLLSPHPHLQVSVFWKRLHFSIQCLQSPI